MCKSYFFFIVSVISQYEQKFTSTLEQSKNKDFEFPKSLNTFPKYIFKEKKNIYWQRLPASVINYKLLQKQFT